MVCKQLGVLLFCQCVEAISAKLVQSRESTSCKGGVCRLSIDNALVQTRGTALFQTRTELGKTKTNVGKDFNADAMEQAILGMLDSTKSSNVSGTLARSKMADFAKAFLPQISEMEGLINKTQKAAVRLLQSHEAAYQSCKSNKSSGLAEVGLMKADRDRKSAVHKSCRNLQAKAKKDHDKCKTDLSLIDNAKKVSCTVYTKHAATQPSCAMLPSNIANYTVWLETHKKFVSEELGQLSKEKAACDTSATALETKEADCNALTKGLPKTFSDQQKQCDKDQIALESATCSFADKNTSVCQQHFSCFNASTLAWELDKPQLQAQETSFHNEWWMLQRMRCFLAAILEADGNAVDSTLVDLCKNKTHTTDFLKLPWFVEPPSLSAQCTEPSKPCSTKFISDEYSGLPAEAPAAQCNACSKPASLILGGNALVYEDAIFKACPSGFTPAPMDNQDSRLAIKDFIASLNMPSGSMFLGNWFMGPGSGGCAHAAKLGYMKVSGKKHTWTELDDLDYQSKVSKAWSGNANCNISPDADGKSYDPPVMYVGPDKSVDLGNCRDACGFSSGISSFTASGANGGNCHNNYNEGCSKEFPVICTGK